MADPDDCDTACEILVSPMPTPRPQPIAVVLRPRARRVVFLDTNKPNSPAILAGAAAILARHGVEIAPVMKKPTSSRPLDDPELEKLAHDPGLIVCGVAD